MADTVNILAEGVINNTTVSVIGADRGIEEEVLGPIRIWHIVFIVAMLLITIYVIFSCCNDFRVPRTRQEIEDNYKKRMLNKEYLRMLERNPDELLRKHEEPKPKPIPKKRPAKPPAVAPRQKPERNNNIAVTEYSGMSPAPARKTPGRKTEAELIEMVAKSSGRPAPKLGIQTPLAVNPRDILALMKKQGMT